MSELISPRSNQYREAREQANNREISVPKVNLYIMSDKDDRGAFVDALRQTPKKNNLLPWSTEDDNGIIFEALQRGVLIDRIPSQLQDLAASKNITGGKKRFLEENPGKQRDIAARFARRYDGKWENSTIAELSWIDGNGRFVRILNEPAFNEVTLSRNQFAISKEAQKAIQETTFGAIGMGVGSACMYLMALGGAKRFVVADGGSIKPHDSNRLIGASVRKFDENHVVHWMQMALDRNPYMHITAYPMNIGEGGVTLEGFLASHQGKGRFVALEVADNLELKIGWREQSEDGVRMVTDVGFAGISHFDSKGEMFQGRLTQNDIELVKSGQPLDLATMTRLAVTMVGPHNVPPEYMRALEDARKAGAPFWPQPAIPAFLTAAMFGTAIAMSADGVPVKQEAVVDLYKSLCK